MAAALRAAKIEVPEIITSGTPALPCALTFPGFKTGQFLHTVSAGTVVYNDMTSLSQLPAEWGFQPAAHVVTTVVSHPSAGVITCDAGHKTVSADAGLPNCLVVGHPKSSHCTRVKSTCPFAFRVGAAIPEIGELLHLVPRHVCPTVNNFDHALLIRGGHIISTLLSVLAAAKLHFPKMTIVDTSEQAKVSLYLCYVGVVELNHGAALSVRQKTLFRINESPLVTVSRSGLLICNPSGHDQPELAAKFWPISGTERDLRAYSIPSPCLTDSQQTIVPAPLAALLR